MQRFLIHHPAIASDAPGEAHIVCEADGGGTTALMYVRVTDATVDAPVDIGVEDLCATCRRCTLDCPPQAISDTKTLVRGTEKWYVDFDRCAPYFSETGGCAICIEVCPWSEPGRGPKLSETLLAKRASRRGNKQAAAAAE